LQHGESDGPKIQRFDSAQVVVQRKDEVEDHGDEIGCDREQLKHEPLRREEESIGEQDRGDEAGGNQLTEVDESHSNSKVDDFVSLGVVFRVAIEKVDPNGNDFDAEDKRQKEAEAHSQGKDDPARGFQDRNRHC